MNESTDGHLPLVSCIMPTYNRRRFVPRAIDYFLRQDYPNKELVIIDDGTDRVADLILADPRIRYFGLPQCASTGAKRNLACKRAAGSLVAHWDDDDWYAPWRLTHQVEQLLETHADICGLDRVFFYAPKEKKGWEYVYPPDQRAWVYGASLCYTRAFFQTHPFADLRVGEDSSFVWADARARVHPLKTNRWMVGLVHGENASPKQTADPRYQPRAPGDVEALLGSDLSFYAAWQQSGAPALALSQSSKRRALISAAQGIGDILRVTPLIRVAHGLGFEVDVLLATDYPEVAQLLEGAPEIRRVIQVPGVRGGTGSAGSLPRDVASEEYEIAAFTAWSAPMRNGILARRALAFDHARWLAEGDSRSVERIAREIGWQGDMPKPFAMASERRFDLPSGTVAIHPGCKAEWPWKKWHGFDELAQKFTSVVIVGTQEDLLTAGTYFQREFKWPERAQNFVGKLSLTDTAALLRECAALISNDSGLMHLAAALGVPTFGIFGITSPQREGMRLKSFHPITKGLPCEAACHAGTWGRRDCDYHLQCLKTLTAEEVFMKVTATLTELEQRSPSGSNRPAAWQLNGHGVKSETINVAYYGNVSDVSGYGHAARAYIHALHATGMNLSVIDLAGSQRQPEDELVRSLVGRTIQPDFHLFHGIPPFWARQAFPLRNVIAMTVWETDTMPPQWRPILNHAIEVWLPCEFNVSVFSRSLEKPVFKLPHPVFPPCADGRAGDVDVNSFLRVGADQFIFYSIFEWQERKCPKGILEAFLRAFPGETDAVLIIKTNPGAAAGARAALAAARRAAPSNARIEIRAEGWSEAEIAALHDRGDCYVSLHRGEGWAYPLFEAATRGEPVIATAYGGPLDYLNCESHELVRHTMCSVQQAYAYYHPAMRWAAPDFNHAIEKMQWVHGNRPAAREKAGKAARAIDENFSLESVGLLAYRRMLRLLQRTNPEKAQRLDGQPGTKSLKPPVPIPGEWFDADYFDHGLKSNWVAGYHWKDFAGLFRETAQFLTNIFPEAASFLDAGCAKGFLVRALRERGKEAWGFDHSQWALERAEETAHPFLKLADTRNVDLGRSFDIVLAFSLFESLTETQAEEFLGRARLWTRDALLAVILVSDPEEAKAALPVADRDLSHITLHSRQWWHSLALRTGWKQDSLHRSLERLCQADPLPARMGWQLFLYAPA